MKLICGLGNPGSKYNHTRHNIGFSVVDALALYLKSDFKTGKGEYDYSKVFTHQQDLILLKPTTFMNLSGKAVQQAMSFYKISITDVLVICDDIHLPLGAVRIRPHGSDGGQNGLKDIIMQLGRNDFTRLRFGIGSPQHKGELSEYVLGKFLPDELPIVQETISHCVGAVLSFVEHGVSQTMAKFNRSPKPTLE